eukprot:TRINITY_DN3246_c0_g2_i5.p2 TRINITY_DN3246_c0_g2~~TRINITY_DN3246_c0_g2_i5.p2  ORF type:complete len:264 (-),score=99.01 TRINITY_DN3246_c0_g2_i5:246-941(-)
MCIRDRFGVPFFFFSSRRRHTRSCLVSWARRCVQETGLGFLFFFFQAEDGIRDHAQSRGLGDVYKRQLLRRSLELCLLGFLVLESGLLFLVLGVASFDKCNCLTENDSLEYEDGDKSNNGEVEHEPEHVVIDVTLLEESVDEVDVQSDDEEDNCYENNVHGVRDVFMERLSVWLPDVESNQNNDVEEVREQEQYILLRIGRILLIDLCSILSQLLLREIITPRLSICCDGK